MCTGFFNFHISESGCLSVHEQGHALLVMQNKIRVPASLAGNETREIELFYFDILQNSIIKYVLYKICI